MNVSKGTPENVYLAKLKKILAEHTRKELWEPLNKTYNFNFLRIY